MRVIIIGGIAAGMSAAAKLRRLDKTAEVVVYEKSFHVSFGACGLPYYVGGFFEEEERMLARTPEQLIESGIELYTNHEVIEVCHDIRQLKVKDIKTGEMKVDAYDKLMIATGAATFIPPIKNIEQSNVYTLRSMEDGRALREALNKPEVKRIGIIGAGFIGLEVVEAAKALGKEVVVFQLEERILKEVFDQEVTDILEAELKAHGVELYLNSKVVALKGEERATHIVTEEEEVAIDVVLVAAGVRPNTAFLEGTGIACLRNGAIIVDEEGRTSLEGVYAAGDCATVPHLLKAEPAYIPLATSANKLGRIVGENLAGGQEVFEGTLGSSCIKLLDLEAGRTGLSEEEAKKLGIDYKTVFITDKNQTDYYPGQEDLSIKLIYKKDTKVLLGGQVVGQKDAVQRTNVLAAAIYAKMTTKQLGMLDLCYAPPFARTWDAINIAGNVAK